MFPFRKCAKVDMLMSVTDKSLPYADFILKLSLPEAL